MTTPESTTIQVLDGLGKIIAQPRAITSLLPITLFLYGPLSERENLESVITNEGKEPLPPGHQIPSIYSLIHSFVLQVDNIKYNDGDFKDVYRVIPCLDVTREVYGIAYRIESARHLYLINKYVTATDPKQAFVLLDRTPFLSTASGFGTPPGLDYQHQQEGYMYIPAPNWNLRYLDDVLMDDVDFSNMCATNAGCV